MILDPLIALCPPEFDIVLADVGSAGGLKDRWRPARPIVSALLFEPRDGGEVTQRGRDTLFPIALGPEAGRATLNVTALPNMSSTLEPNRPLLETFRKKGEHTRILSTLEMPVDTLDAVVGGSTRSRSTRRAARLAFSKAPAPALRRTSLLLRSRFRSSTDMSAKRS
jgi:hypothetical protein